MAKSDVDAGGHEFGRAEHAAAFAVTVVAALQVMLISGLAITLTPDSAISGRRRRGRMSIRSAAARSREELEKFENKERRRKEAVKKEKELLERQVNQLESQARQATRAENLKEEKRVCYLLRAIMIKAL